MTTTIYTAHDGWAPSSVLRAEGLPRKLLGRLARSCWRGRAIVRAGLVLADLPDGAVAEIVVCRGAITVTRTR